MLRIFVPERPRPPVQRVLVRVQTIEHFVTRRDASDIPMEFLQVVNPAPDKEVLLQGLVLKICLLTVPVPQAPLLLGRVGFSRQDVTLVTRVALNP